VSAQLLVPCPLDFCQVANGKLKSEIARHYGRSSQLVTRWMGLQPQAWQAAHNIQCKPRKNIDGFGSNKRVPPQNFVELFKTMSRKKIAIHCNVSEETIQRWLRDLSPENLAVINEARAALRRENSTIAARKSGILRKQQQIRTGGGYSKTWAPQQKTIIRSGCHDEAAQFLRRHYSNVCRDKIYGERLYSAHMADMWHCGRLWFTPDGLLEEAARRGWNPNAWQSL